MSFLKALVIGRPVIDDIQTTQTCTYKFQFVSNRLCRVVVGFMVLQCYVKLIVIFASVQISTQPHFVSTSQTVTVHAKTSHLRAKINSLIFFTADIIQDITMHCSFIITEMF